MVIQADSEWWLIPAAIDGVEVDSRRAVEHAIKHARRYSSHPSLLEALGELLRLRR
jgi:hypothetical protein